MTTLRIHIACPKVPGQRSQPQARTIPAACAILGVVTSILSFCANCRLVDDYCASADPTCNPLALIVLRRVYQPRFVYSGNFSGATITGYSLDYGSGMLTPLGTLATATSAHLSIHPGGRVLYSSNGTSLTSYVIDQGTGLLTAGATLPTVAASGLIPGAFGRFGYVLNTGSGTIDTYFLDGESGGMSFVSTTSANGTSNFAALHPGGLLLYVANSSGNVSGFSVDPNTGLVALATQTPLAVARGVAIDPLGRYVYVTDNTNSLKVYSIQGDGSLLSIGTAPTGTFNTFVAAAPGAHSVYTTNQTSNDVSALSVGPTGALMSIANRAAGAGPIGIAIDFTGRYLYANGSSATLTAFAIDAVTGDLTQIGTQPAGTGAQAVAIHNQRVF